LADDVRKHAALIKVSACRGAQTYAQEEVLGFVNHLNANLAGDPILANETDNSLFKAAHDGQLLC
jgi:hypothetical protein